MKKKVLSVILLTLGAGFLFADVRENLLLQMRVYIHRPELFVDPPFGMLPKDARIPIPGLWYVRMAASTAQLYGFEALRDLLEKREIPGLDFSGQKDIFSTHLERLFRRDLPRELAQKRVHPNYKFRLLKLAGTRIDDRLMPFLRELRDLEVLTLNDQITDSGAVWLKNLTGLRELGLAGSQVTDAGIGYLKDLIRLQRLDLRGTRVTDKGMAALSALPLEELQLGPSVGDEGALIATSIRTLGQLELSQTRVSDKGLAALAGKLQIHTLFLGSQTTDEGLKAISKISTLQRLDMTAARITNEGVRALAALPDLQELALTNTPIRDQAISSLLGLRRLRFLEISDTGVTLTGLQRLAELPSLQVISFSSKEDINPAHLRVWRKLPRLHTIIINGRPMNTEWMEKMRGPGRLGWFYFNLVLEAEAAEDLPAIEVAQHPDTLGSNVRLTGLRLIHQVESELDHVIPAPIMINVDNQQDTEKNFLGEMEINSRPSGRKKEANRSLQTP